MLTVEIKWCPSLIIFDDYILLEASRPLPRCQSDIPLQGVDWRSPGTKHLCFSQARFITPRNTKPPDNQPKHFQAFILKIPTAKTRRGLDWAQKGWNWRLLDMLNNAAGKNNTHLWSGEIQGHSWCDEALWFSSVLHQRGNKTCAVPPLAGADAVCMARIVQLLCCYNPGCWLIRTN